MENDTQNQIALKIEPSRLKTYKNFCQINKLNYRILHSNQNKDYFLEFSNLDSLEAFKIGAKLQRYLNDDENIFLD